MATATSELGRELQLVHAAQWLYSVNDEPFVAGAGDAYARLVRGFDEDPAPVLASIAERGPLWRSRLDTWVSADRETVGWLLGHPDTAVASAVPQSVPWLPDVERQRTRGPVRDLVYRGGTGAVRAGSGRLREEVERVVARLGPGPVDLVADFVTPLTAAVYAALLEVPEERRTEFAASVADVAPAVDALLCPQTLAVTRRVDAGLLRLRGIFGGRRHAEADLLLAVAGTRAAADLLGNALADLLHRPEEWERLSAEPEHAQRAAVDLLRAELPWQVYPLVVVAPIERAGERIAAGENVSVVPTPDRDPADLAAPYGRLFLAAARAQAVWALTTLATRFPRLRPADEPVRERRAPVTRRLARLSARLGEEETR